MLIVKYKSTRRTSCFNFIKNTSLKLHDYVFVKVLGNDRLAEIIFLDDKITRENIPVLSIRNVRKASKKELELFKKVEKKKSYAMSLFTKKNLKFGLNLKLVDVKYHLIKNTFTFIIKAITKDISLDGFLRELSGNLKARVEVKPIGSRDETRRKGGLGLCGRQLCCSAFLKGFEFVTIKMVKDQNLSLNPSRISGACGKLLCCIKYENEYYSLRSRLNLKVNPEILLKNCKKKDDLDKNDNKFPYFY